MKALYDSFEATLTEETYTKTQVAKLAADVGIKVMTELASEMMRQAATATTPSDAVRQWSRCEKVAKEGNCPGLASLYGILLDTMARAKEHGLWTEEEQPITARGGKGAN